MINKVILLGNLGKDPEKIETSSGVQLAKFSIATSKSYKKGEEWQKETAWHTITCWRDRATFAIDKLRKGDLVYIEGEIKTRDWEDEAGKKHYATEIHAHVMRRCNKRDENPQSGFESREPDFDKLGDPKKIAPAGGGDDLPF